MKNKAPLITAIVLGVLAVLLVYSYINRVRASVTSGMGLVKVVVASRSIAKGERLSRENMAYWDFPAKFVGERAIKGKKEEVALIMGQPVINNLQEGQPILWSDLGERKPEGLSSVIGIGERAVTISVNEITGTGGLILPNDHVDIVWTFEASSGDISSASTNVSEVQEAIRQSVQELGQVETRTAVITLLQNVTVLATGKVLTQSEVIGGEVQYGNVTLLVTPYEAEMLIFAQGHGLLTLVLRNREDLEVIEEIPKVTVSEMMNQVWPQKLTKERKARIEVIRGQKKTVE